MGPFTAAFLVVVMLLLAFSVEVWRLHALTNGVYDAMRSATVTAVTENAPALYAAQTDMAGSAYAYIGTGWQSDADTSAITDVLANHLDLRQSGVDWVFYDGSGREVYRLVNLNVQVTNPYAPSGSPGNAPMLTITVTYTLKTTLQAGLAVSASVPMKVVAGLGGKF
jgi:hypothetical protein